MDLYKIKNKQSRANFEHILQSYYAKNYKACILLLYDLVVNDLYGKMILMNESGYIDLDKNIKEIEKILEGKNSSDTKYSEIEKKIFEIYQEQRIIGDSTISLLKYLKETRDMCAHPFVFGEKDYIPEEELVFAFITKIYNDILIVGAFFKKPYEIIKKEINEHIYPKLNTGAMFIFSKQTVEKEIKQAEKLLNKYFTDFTDDNLKRVFNASLVLIIGKRSEEIQRKQYANFLVLSALLDYINNNGKNSLIENCFDWEKIEIDNIKDEKSDSFDEDWLALTYLYEILLKRHYLLNEIKSKKHDIFELLESSIYKNIEYFIKYWTIFESNINESIKKLDDVGSKEYCRILDNFVQELDTENLIDLFKKMFAKIPIFNGYDDADNCLESFLKIIKTDIKRFPQDDLRDVFNILNNNRQIYDKLNGAKLEELMGLGYDFSIYENIKNEEGKK